jgi:hypothetical protein
VFSGRRKLTRPASPYPDLRLARLLKLNKAWAPGPRAPAQEGLLRPECTAGSADDGPPRLAILFWFYKELDLCAARVAELRALNPQTQIFGLFGGAMDAAAQARAQLGSLLDDLYVFSEDRDAHWKWLNGDHVIAAWMRDRGEALDWDTLVLVQWDMLVAAPVGDLFGSLRKGEAVFSGFDP